MNKLIRKLIDEKIDKVETDIKWHSDVIKSHEAHIISDNKWIKKFENGTTKIYNRGACTYRKFTKDELKSKIKFINSCISESKKIIKASKRALKEFESELRELKEL